MNWIPCKERMPTEDGLYLVSAESFDSEWPKQFTAWWNQNDKRWEGGWEDWHSSISHWIKIEKP